MDFIFKKPEYAPKSCTWEIDIGTEINICVYVFNKHKVNKYSLDITLNNPFYDSRFDSRDEIGNRYSSRYFGKDKLKEEIQKTLVSIGVWREGDNIILSLEDM